MWIFCNIYVAKVERAVLTISMYTRFSLIHGPWKVSEVLETVLQL